ncbi:MAG: hypothetical protein RIE73_31610 [Coleofasciculus sp. C1-SOL-03]
MARLGAGEAGEVNSKLYLLSVVCSLFPVPCCLLSVVCSLFPVPCSLLTFYLGSRITIISKL